MTMLTPAGRRLRLARRLANAALALVVSAALLGVLAAGFHGWPALGPALDPSRGAWTSAAGGVLPSSQQLTVPGLTKPVQVSFTSQGLASIDAATDDDLFLALGYVQAKFRLTEMDLSRRLGEGRLAQLAGPSAVASDKFELRLGLLRTAQAEWAAMPKSSQPAQALIWFSRGVNDYLAQLRKNRQWPAVYSMTGVYPANWTPVDSLVVQGTLTQELDFTDTPLDYALLDRSLGAARTMAWFPVLPPNQQSPYDTGPYRKLPLAALPGASSRLTADSGAASRSRPEVSAASARADAAVLAQLSALPAGQVYEAPASNAWAANGFRVAGGRAMLAGDPHLPQTLPSVWFQVALSAPGFAVSGVSVPGLPGVLIGHNQHIAWSMTDTQNQATLYYDERTSPSRPGQYFWRGRWRQMRQLHYTIPVRGGATQRLTVDETVHGPVLTRAGQTVSVDWMGALGSPDIAVLDAIGKASDFAQFRAALASWRSPTLNFVFADDRGQIGAISAGYYPQVAHGDPWLPMPGTGADDVVGVIPYRAVPQVYDPRSHVVATANQRPVTGKYPYYIGTTANFFDPGYRANEEYSFLTRRHSMRAATFAALQSSVTDQLAATILPRLRAALRGTKLTAVEQQAEQEFDGWNYSMSTSSASAVIWWTFWSDYLSEVFSPWWRADHVPVSLDRKGLAVGPSQSSLDEVLEAWTLHDQRNPAFTPPGGARRSAVTAMRSAFAAAVAQLSRKQGASPSGWTWGKVHFRRFPSLLTGSSLGYGPKPASGDPWTVDAAEGGLTSTVGPSWRMIVHFTGPGKPVGEGIYPGGQSENPASPWYTNLVADWWAGKYLPMPAAGSTAGPVHWDLVP